MLELRTAFTSTTEEAVATFERRLGVQLPADYRRFLIETNGGEPVNGAFVVGDWGSTHVHFFYGLGTGYDGYNLDWSRSVFEDRLPEVVTPVACDPGGCLLCLGIEGSSRGKVYFWDRGERFDALVQLAESFEAFVRGLHSG